ncbi:MAG: hypothetical protein KC583_15935, partial [Myxococcales bacterium]|nr:hypothetical protein [Myxococcales bacterium]
PAFACLFNRCIPSGARCDSCAVVGCPEGQQCSEFTGQCSERAGRCGSCQEDGDCGADLFCRPVGLGRNCVEACVDGACPDGFRCDGGACLPQSGFCDACGGCGGALPVCNPINRTCVECGPGNPCALGTVCDLNGACVAPPMGVECNSNLDCRDAARPICDMQRCIGCRDDAGCPAGQTCVDNACADAGDPCAGVTCQEGSACAAGRCEPGCARDADCGDERRCNPATGQCYRGDQRCDRDGATAVCAPGSVCRDDPLDRNRTVCTCLKTDPNDGMEANEDHRVPCNPGGQCLQFGADPGVCIAP